MIREFLKPILVDKESVFLTSGMTVKPVVLQGNYSDKPYEVVSDKQFDQVWSNIIDLFVTKGLSIKLIDKNSGLIISEKTSFISDYTFEDMNGALENANASIVIEKKLVSGFNQFFRPQKITGECNIRIKENGTGKIVVNVNLTNIEATSFILGSQYSTAQNLLFNGESTGKFEELITGLIK